MKCPLLLVQINVIVMAILFSRAYKHYAIAIAVRNMMAPVAHEQKYMSLVTASMGLVLRDPFECI